MNAFLTRVKQKNKPYDAEVMATLFPKPIKRFQMGKLSSYIKAPGVLALPYLLLLGFWHLPTADEVNRFCS